MDSRKRGEIATRRTHIKSKRGCTTCKRRNVRCDENRLKCFNCTRLQVPCEYQSPTSDPEVPPCSSAIVSTSSIIHSSLHACTDNGSPSAGYSVTYPPSDAIANASTLRNVRTASMDPYPPCTLPMTVERREQLAFCNYRPERGGPLRRLIYSGDLAVYPALQRSNIQAERFLLNAFLPMQIPRKSFNPFFPYPPLKRLGTNLSFLKPLSNLRYCMQCLA